MTRNYDIPATLRIALTAALFCAVAAVFSGCSRDDTVALLVRHNAPPEQPQHRALLRVAKLLEDRTDGRIMMEVIASLPVPGQMDDIRAGAREIGMTGAQGIADFFPPFAVFEAPYVFRDLDHFYATIRSPIGQRILRESEEVSNIHVLDVWHQGVRQVTLRDIPAQTPAEFGNVKLRIPGAVMFVEAAKVLGALPTTMAFENVNLGLRSAIIDGQENPLPTIKAMGFQEHCKYLVLTNHIIGTILPAINGDYWRGLSPTDQETITQAFREGGDYNRRIIEEEEARLVEEFANQGMIVLRPDLTVFRERAERTWLGFRELWGDSLVAEIQAVSTSSISADTETQSALSALDR